MKKFNFIILAIAIVGMGSCSKEILQTTRIDGTYTGVFEISNTDSPATARPLQGLVNVNFNGIDYTCASNSSYAYAGGSGKFFIKKDVMTFTDMLMHPASFDWDMVLNGSYAYSIEGDKITLVKKQATKTVTYRLKKQ
jgi:hypothetical protein